MKRKKSQGPAVRDALRRKYLLPFVELVFQQLDPNTELRLNFSHEALCFALEQAERGELTRLLANEPPRMLKSTITSVAFPAWLLGRDPTTKIIVASYSQELAEKFSNDTRRVMKSAWYRKLFPGTRISPLKDSANNFETTRGGGRFATSVNGPIAGFGGNFIILDDPEKPTDMTSEVTRQGTKDWFSNSVMTRLNDPATGVIIVVTHRLHEDDLSSSLLTQESWTHLSFPAIASRTMKYPLSARETHILKKGELLHPEHLSSAVLEDRRRSLGARVFQAQYLQDPAPDGNSLSAWYLIKTVSEAPKRFDYIVQSWDIATTQGRNAKYSACITFKIVGDIAYIVDADRFQLETPDLLTIIQKKQKQWDPASILIENTGPGLQIWQMLKRQRVDCLIPCTPTKDKWSRLLGIEDKLRAGQLIVVEGMRGFESFRSEFLSFPGGRYNDFVDATTQFMAQFEGFVRRTRAIEKRQRVKGNKYARLMEGRPRSSSFIGTSEYEEELRKVLRRRR